MLPSTWFIQAFIDMEDEQVITYGLYEYVKINGDGS